MPRIKNYIEPSSGAALVYGDYWLMAGIRPYTIRIQFSDPVFNPVIMGQYGKAGSYWTRVSSSPNVWDFTYGNANWREALRSSGNYYDRLPNCDILQANLHEVTDLTRAFQSQTHILSVNLEDLWSCTSLHEAFSGCAGLTSIKIGDIGFLVPNSTVAMTFSPGDFESVEIGDIYNQAYWTQFQSGGGPATSCSSFKVGVQFRTTDMHNFFEDVIGNNLTITLGDMPSLTNADHMFSCCGYDSGTFVPITYNIGRMPSLANAHYMFYRCSIEAAPDLNFGNVTDASWMFSESNIVSAPDYNLPSATDARSMFDNCPRLMTAPLMHLPSDCDIGRLFYCDLATGNTNFRYSTQNAVDLYLYYCDPSLWSQGAVAAWEALHGRNDAYQYYLANNSWNSTDGYSQLYNFGQYVGGQQSVPDQWWGNATMLLAITEET